MSDHYKLRCLGDNTLFDDIWYDSKKYAQDTSFSKSPKGYLLANPHYAGHALLRTEYLKPLAIDASHNNIFKYSWLPIHDTFECMSAPVTFKSEKFAHALKLKNLYCTFSGYAPSKRAFNRTCSFKEFEAVGVLGRHNLKNTSTIVLASAGNTARAFMEIGALLPIKIIIIVPESATPELWTTHEKIGDNITLCSIKNGDYSDAIAIANLIARADTYVPEGGVLNVGRRDGMGTCMLSAVECIGHIPDHFFQSAGSASGAISAWETTMRLKTMMNTPGVPVPKLHISQNVPFTPIIDSWEKRSPHLLPVDKNEARAQIDSIDAKVLSNRTPPYSTIGGIYQAMTVTQGEGYKVTNKEGVQARDIFHKLEGILVDPPTAITCASLIQAVEQKKVHPDDTIMLNLTGGGYDEVVKDYTITRVPPTVSLPAEIDAAQLASLIIK